MPSLGKSPMPSLGLLRTAETPNPNQCQEGHGNCCCCAAAPMLRLLRLHVVRQMAEDPVHLALNALQALQKIRWTLRRRSLLRPASAGTVATRQRAAGPAAQPSGGGRLLKGQRRRRIRPRLLTIILVLGFAVAVVNFANLITCYMLKSNMIEKGAHTSPIAKPTQRKSITLEINDIQFHKRNRQNQTSITLELIAARV